MIVELASLGAKEKSFVENFKIMTVAQQLIRKAQAVSFCLIIGCSYETDFKGMLTSTVRLLEHAGQKDLKLITPVFNARHGLNDNSMHYKFKVTREYVKIMQKHLKKDSAIT